MIESRESSTSEEQDWLVPYGTLMTILMIFFLILWSWNYYVQTSLEKLKEEEAINEIEDALQDVASISINQDEIELQLPAAVLFDIGDATLKPAAKRALSRMAHILKKSDGRIVVKGHTDNYPIINGVKYRSNWHLSCARAFSVIRYLIDVEGIAPERLAALGYAEYNPKYPFDTIVNRSKNRRIEISLLKEEIVR